MLFLLSSSLLFCLLFLFFVNFSFSSFFVVVVGFCFGQPEVPSLRLACFHRTNLIFFFFIFFLNLICCVLGVALFSWLFFFIPAWGLILQATKFLGLSQGSIILFISPSSTGCLGTKDNVCTQVLQPCPSFQRLLLKVT